MKDDVAGCDDAQRLVVTLRLQRQRSLGMACARGNVVEVAGFAETLQILTRKHPPSNLIGGIEARLSFVEGDESIALPVISRNRSGFDPGSLRAM